MVLSEEVDEGIIKEYTELCADLNMDKNTADEAWQNYETIKQNYTLEGNQLHWLGCSLYVACRKATIPTVGRSGAHVEGNCVSLTRLLRSCHMSLIQFFDKSKKWADMANLSQEFRSKIERLERNFAVSTVLFKKFQPIFSDMFENQTKEQPRLPRNRKQRKAAATLSEVFNFCWTLFVCVKGNFQQISDDLVNSYHLLLACCDLFFGNVLVADRRDILNPEFSGMPESYRNKTALVMESPCIIHDLCQRHDGIHVEAKHIKEYWWKPHLKQLFEDKVLKGSAEKLTGLLDLNTFEVNSKSVDKVYEEFVLSCGDFDERIYLGDGANEEIGAVAKISDLTEKMNAKRNQQHSSSMRHLAPSTPLTGRNYLRPREHASITPVSTATQSVSRLQSLLSGRKASASDALLEIFKSCSRNPDELIKNLIKNMSNTFCMRYAQRTTDHPGSHTEFAKKRLQLGETLFYKVLEHILQEEQKRKKEFDLTYLLEQEIFHQSLFACCLEIVIFSYNSQRAFPWILEIFGLEPFHFYKVIEVIIRAEDQLSRDVVKHLNHIEEKVLESLAWRTDSPLWETIKKSGPIPMYEEVSLQSQTEMEKLSSGSQYANPVVRRLASHDRTTTQYTLCSPQQSPLSSVTERFQSPVNVGSARKRLFVDAPNSTSNLITTTTTNSISPQVAPAAIVSTALASQWRNVGQSVLQSPGKTVAINIKTIPGENGEQYIPISYMQGTGSVLIQGPSANTFVVAPASNTTSPAAKAQDEPDKPKPKKTGSLGLFFRKFYYLASVRLQELCNHLTISEGDLRQKIWTCFEHSIVCHSDLMQDRHLDQILMCAVYVVCKVTANERTFTEVMRCYRLQPQAASHVYRSVLLNTKHRRGSGSSNDTSSSNSPTPSDEAETKDDTRERIRSSSTLPVPHPTSAPPTPTCLTGNSSSFEFEDRGDLIMFYNTVYVQRIQRYALKFSKTHTSESLSLSPLPQLKAQPNDSCRKVSERHLIFTRSLRCGPPKSPSKPLQYCFHKSPSKDLHMINNMVQDGRKVGKRLLVEDGHSDGSPIVKKPAPVLCSKIQNVVGDRQASQNQIAAPTPVVVLQQ